MLAHAFAGSHAFAGPHALPKQRHRRGFFLQVRNYFEASRTKGYSHQQFFPSIMSLATSVPVNDTSETSTASTVNTPVLRRIALPALFCWFGLIMGSWVGRIPALRDGVQVSHAGLSMVLLMGGIGAVLSFPVSSQLMGRFGGRQSMLISGMALLGVLLAIAAAPSVPLLMAAVLMLGISASTFDTGMNAVAVGHERSAGTSKMAMLHACACAGGLVGVSLSGAMAAMQVTPLLHYTLLALPCALLLKFGIDLVVVDSAERIPKKSFIMPSGGLALLGALGFLGAIAEGSIADWSGVFMKDHFRVSDGFAPLALMSFSAMMLLSRLMGDRLKMRYGANVLVAGGAITAAAGLFYAVITPSPYFAVAGFAVAGMGLSLIFPFVFSAAGREGTLALSGVATMTYSGMLLGPPVLGTIAHSIGIKAGIGFVGLLAMVIAIIATRTRLLR